MMRTKWLPTPAWLLVVVGIMACRPVDDGVYHLSGMVTHGGQPVPSGFIFFEPDTSRQNRGSQGYALIQDGRYTTRGEFGKGVVGGPYRIRIGGFSGTEINETQPYGVRLFPDSWQTQELPQQDAELDWVVP